MTDNSVPDNFETNLIGEITSISDVANNTNGEWNRLVGSDVRAFSGDDIQTILTRTSIEIGAQTQQQALSIYNEFKKGYAENATSELSDEFRQNYADQLAEALKETRPDLYEDLMNSTSVMFSKDKKHDYIAQISVNIEHRLAENRLEAVTTPNARIVTIPSNFTKEDMAAQIMGVPRSELPSDSVPGTDEFWRAALIIHELEHLTEQKPVSGIDDSRYNETDSDMAMFKLLEKHDENGEFREYFMHARMIEGVNFSVRRGPDASEHYSYDSLKGQLGQNDDNYQVSEGNGLLASLSEKIRDEVGVPEGHNGEVTIPLQQIALAVEKLLDGTSNTHRLAAAMAETDHEIDTEILTPEEREVAQNFLESLKETGFTEMWSAESQAQPDRHSEEIQADQNLTSALSTI